MKRTIILQLTDDKGNISTSTFEYEHFVEVTEKTGLDMIRKTFHDLEKILLEKPAETCYCCKNHVYGFVEGENYKFEIRENSIGVLNESQKTWYNFHIKNQHKDYFTSTDFYHYFHE